MSNLISNRLIDLVPKRIYDEYLTRDDLQKVFNLKSFTGVLDFYLWWKEYAELKEYNYYWLPSHELSEKLFTSKIKNGIYSAHISIANRFKSKNECKKILHKGKISELDYKRFKDWLQDSYYDIFPNNSYIFSDLSDLGKENLINNTKTKFISYKSNEYLIISEYLSLILLFLRSSSYKKDYQIKIKQLMIDKSKNISFEYLPEIMKFFNQKILTNESNIKSFFYEYLNQNSTNSNLPNFLDMLTKRKDIRQLYKESSNKEFFMINWWYQSGKKEYKFANKLKINFSEKINNIVDKKFLKKENISFEILKKKNIDEFIHNSKSFIVPSFLVYIYNKRSDLRDSFYKSELPFRLFIFNWWILYGRDEYPDLHWEPLNFFKEKILDYLKSFELKILSSGLNKFEESDFEDYFLICSYYEKRIDLQNAFKNSSSVAESLYNWFINSGINEDNDLKNIKNRSPHEILPTLKKYFRNKELNIKNNFIDPLKLFSIIERIKNFFLISNDINQISIPSFLIYIYEKRPDIKNAFYDSELPFRLFIINWWILYGRDEYPELKWDPKLSKNKSLIEYIKKLELKIINTNPQKYELLKMDEHYLIFKNYQERPDLQIAFRNTFSVAESLYNWFINSGINEDNDLKNIKNKSDYAIIPNLKKCFKNKKTINKTKNADPLKLFTVFERINNFFNIPDDIKELTIPSFLIYIFSNRLDIKNEFYKSEMPFRLFIIDWWLLYGREEYPDLKWEPSNSYKRNLLSYIENLKSKITKSGPHKYKHLFIDDYISIFKYFKKRIDLQDAFKNASSKSTSLYNWFINSGVHEDEALKNIEGRYHYEIIPSLDKCFINKKINKENNLEPIKLFTIFERINKYFILPDEIFDSSIPAFLIYIYESRKDIKEAFNKCQLPFRLFIINWWIFYGIAEYPDLKWEPSTAYKKDLLSYIKNLELKITNSGPNKYEESLIDESVLIYRFYQVRSDLQDAFKQSPSISTSLYNWFINSGVLENEGLNNIKNKSFYEIIPTLERCLINKKIRKLNDEFYERLFKTLELIKSYFQIKDERNSKPVQEKVKSSFFRSILDKDILSKSIGFSDKSNEYAKAEIAVVGLHNYQLGISEDARNIYKCLLGFNKSIKASDIPIISKNKFINLNYKLFNYIDSKKTIIVLPPTELVTLYLKNQLYFNSKLKYALIPWELPRLHRSFIDILSSFDLLLAPSKFVRSSLLDVHKNVKLLPHFVDLDKKYRTKKYKEFTFLYSADLNSFIKRKNPLCAIKAFKLFLKKVGKFNKNEPKLILRLSNLGDKQLIEIKKNILNISNFILITKQLDREDYINLLAKSHCFVSPHRSEGFGRNIAEAMFLNTPVITSNYSGNLDFCFDNNSYLINGNLIPLKKGDYPCCEDSYWFDPDYLHLSELMYEVFTNYDKAIKKSKLAQQTIENNHSLNTYKKNLKNLLL